MKYARTAGLFFDTPLAMLPAKIEEITTFWQAKLAGATLDFEDLREPFEARLIPIEAGLADEEAATSAFSAQGGGMIAVLPLYGIMAQRMNMMTAMSGGTSTQMFASALRDLVDNPQVKAIIIDTDSPGGSVHGTAELANAIYSMRGTKPIIAQVNSLASSAAYWAISQADEIVATVGADLGHIGVAALLVDRSGEAEQAGIKVMQVTAGKYKHEQAIGADLRPWTDEQVQHAQQRVDEAYAMFTAAVARGRGVKASDVRDGFAQGRVVGAQEAVRLGMADRIATLDETIQRFANGGRVSRRGAAAEVVDTEIMTELEAASRFIDAQLTPPPEPDDEVDEAGVEDVDPLEVETQQRERAYQYEEVTQ